MASRRPIYTFQLTGYATKSNEKNIFAVLCDRLTPLTTFINWYVFLKLIRKNELKRSRRLSNEVMPTVVFNFVNENWRVGVLRDGQSGNAVSSDERRSLFLLLSLIIYVMSHAILEPECHGTSSGRANIVIERLKLHAHTWHNQLSLGNFTDRSQQQQQQMELRGAAADASAHRVRV